MNREEAKQFLKQNIIARVPLITFITIERKRSIKIITEVMKDLNLDVKIHSMSKGFTLNDEALDSDKTILGSLEFITKDLSNNSNQIYVLTDASDFLDNTTSSRILVDLLSTCEQKNSTIIIISTEPLWDMIQKYGASLVLDYPNEIEISKIISGLIKQNSDIKNEWSQENIKEAATILSGLSEMEIRNIISMLIAKKEVLLKDLTRLKFTKDSMFNNIEGLEKIEVENDLTFAGLENLKEWLSTRKKLLTPSKQEELRQRGMRPPRGVLLVGVPGCGKSLCAKAISKIWELPLYLLDFATVQGMYVGQSEQQLKKAFMTAEQLSPCILWIDEIEKGLSDSSSSSVTTKLVGQFLFWLQECRKQVFVVATANDISKLPPELLRKGRFDEMFFVDLPNNKERYSIIDMYTRKYLRVKLGEQLLNTLVMITDKYTSADLESIIRNIAFKQISNPDLQITEELIIGELKNSISLSNTNPESIEKIRKWAEGRTINASEK